MAIRQLFSELSHEYCNRTRMCDGVSDARASTPPEPSYTFLENPAPILGFSTSTRHIQDESSSGSTHQLFQNHPHSSNVNDPPYPYVIK